MNISENITELEDNMIDEDIEDIIYGNNEYNLEYDINEARVLYNGEVGCIDWNDETDSMMVIWDDMVITINNKEVPIEYDDINLFTPCINRFENDKNNKKRENIIIAIINKQIIECWYIEDKWKTLKDKLYGFLDYNKPSEYESIECILKAGRMFNYDFDIIYKTSVGDIIEHYEFKFNAHCVTGLPQFLSLPSRFNTNYAEFFYDNYLSQIKDLYNIDMISKEVYLSSVYKINYNVNPFFDNIYTYENGESLGFPLKKKKEIVDKSIHNYLIKLTNTQGDLLNYYSLNDDILNEHFVNKLKEKFIKTQSNKKYMCFHNGEFHFDEIKLNELFITKDKFRLKSGNHGLFNTLIFYNDYSEIHMLLRWRNHAGILNPAWQISIKRLT